MGVSKSKLRTPLARVRGLGAAHSGTGHFWAQRVTALIMIPLSIWFLSGLVQNAVTGDRASVAEWFKCPGVALAAVIFFGAMFYHAKLGIQVIVEDYVHCEFKKIATLLISGAAHLVLGLMAILAVAHLNFFGI